MPLPSVVCVGPMKTSTSWLYRQLRTHPDVWLSPIKELHVLDYLDVGSDSDSLVRTQAYQRKLYALRAAIQSVMDREHVSPGNISRIKLFADAALANTFDFEWYRSFFDDAPEDKVVAEIAPTYAYADDKKVQQYANFIGADTKIIIILRNPIDRWLSKGRFDLKIALNQDLNKYSIPFMAEQLSNQWKTSGGYQEYIEIWERHFDAVSFVFFEDLHSSDGVGLKQVCDCIGVEVPTEFFPGRSAQVNTQGTLAIPSDLRDWIAVERASELNWLAERFGGHALHWRDHATAPSTP